MFVTPIIHTQGKGNAQPCDSVQTCTPKVGTWRCHTKFFTAFKTLATATQAGGRQGAQHNSVRPAPSTFHASDIKKTPCALRAWAWGGRGRRFKSGHSDQYVKNGFPLLWRAVFSCRNILTQKSSEMIGAFGFILHLRKLCKFCFQCRIDLCVKLVVFLILRYSLCFRLLYLVGLYYCLTSFRY